jgi:acetylornithine deacetylase/succinyl-diaminopimelate desuccinylase-like protein
VARGRGRLGPFLNTSDPRADLVKVLHLLDQTPAPRGRERAAAARLRAWCAARWPAVNWTVLPYGDHGASLFGSHGSGPLLYSHLDTSLDGSVDDRAVTGSDPPGALIIDGDIASGFGLGVARAPAAAALVAFASASSGTLLLAGSGTHRRGSGPTGLTSYLARGSCPASAVVAKAGPRTVLWEEPGALYLSVRVRGRHGAALAPDSAVPAGGVVTHAGVVLDALSAWLTDYARSRPATGQVGPVAGIGSIRAGWGAKPDLLPAELELGVYVVTVPGEDPAAIEEQVRCRVATAVAQSPLAPCDVCVDREVVADAACTPPDAPVVKAAVAAWTAEFGTAPPPITGWTGSTDGVVLRAKGIDTVRVGPTIGAAPDDRSRDQVSVSDLARFVSVYRQLLRACP